MKFDAKMVRSVALCGSSLIAPLAGCGRAEPPAGPARVIIEASASGPWRIEMRLAKPVDRLNLGKTLDGFRARHWRIVDGEAVLRPADGFDWLEAKRQGRPFDSVAFSVAPRSDPLPKDYQAFTPMGEGGVLIYSGHFMPKTDDGALFDVRFDMVAAKGHVLSAYEQTAPAFKDWASPYGQPAFIYAGPVRPAETEAATTIIDANAPDWVRDEIAALAPALFAAYEQGLGRALPARPNLFLDMGDASVEGELSYRGDALAGQFQATLEGGAWSKESAEARRTLLATTAHEVAHLYQLTAKSRDGAPDFINEGGADALASEALVAIGRWTLADAEDSLAEAAGECARLTEGRSLATTEAASVWRASYACGHVLTVVAAGSAGPAAFWRRLMERADADGGYDLPLFLAVARETAGGDAADAIEAFIRTNEARPDLALERLLVASGRAP
jgi:hypothetical protein